MTSRIARAQEMLSQSADPLSRRYMSRVVVICVDHSGHSEYAVAWAAENIVQPGDHVHIVTAISALSDPIYTLGMRAHTNS